MWCWCKVNWIFGVDVSEEIGQEFWCIDPYLEDIAYDPKVH